MRWRTAANAILGLILVINAVAKRSSSVQERQSSDDQCFARDSVHLTSQQHAYLQEYGFLLEHGSLLITHKSSGSSDCHENDLIGKVIMNGIAGRSTPEDVETISRLKPKIDAVLSKIWPLVGNSPAFPADGALFIEKWGLLQGKFCNEDTASKLVNAYIEKSGLTSEAAAFLLDRRLPLVDISLSKILSSHSPAIDTDQKLYAFAILQKNSKVSFESGVRYIQDAGILTQKQKAIIATLDKKRDRPGTIVWSDIEGLENSY